MFSFFIIKTKKKNEFIFRSKLCVKQNKRNYQLSEIIFLLRSIKLYINIYNISIINNIVHIITYATANLCGYIHYFPTNYNN